MRVFQKACGKWNWKINIGVHIDFWNSSLMFFIECIFQKYSQEFLYWLKSFLQGYMILFMMSPYYCDTCSKKGSEHSRRESLISKYKPRSFENNPMWKIHLSFLKKITNKSSNFTGIWKKINFFWSFTMGHSCSFLESLDERLMNTRDSNLMYPETEFSCCLPDLWV